MLIHPQTAINEGWLSGIRNPSKQIQPNAIDVTLDSIRKINTCDTFCLTEKDKMHRQSKELKVTDSDGWTLNEGVYDAMSEMYVELPEGYAGWLVSRSSLVRNGVMCISGVYDSGFCGHLGAALHIPKGYVKLEQHVRFAQFVIVQSESAGLLYQGDYNHQKGTDWKQ